MINITEVKKLNLVKEVTSGYKNTLAKREIKISDLNPISPVDRQLALLLSLREATEDDLSKMVNQFRAAANASSTPEERAELTDLHGRIMLIGEGLFGMTWD